MANTIKLKRGTSTPSTSDISNGEVAIDTSAKKLYINDSGTVKEIGGSGSVGGASGLDFNDDVKVRFGTGNDLEIFHDGTNNIIKAVNSNATYIDAQAAWLYLQSNAGIQLGDVGGNEVFLKATDNGAVELYYDGTKKFETSASGLKWYDDLNCDDLDKIRFGNSQDLQIYHDGTDSRIHNSTGRLVTRSATESCWYNAAGSETLAKFIVDGAVELYYDAVKKLETASDKILFHAHAKVNADNTYDLGASGARWKDLYIYNDIDIKDNGKILLGDGDDLQLYHSGTNSVIDNNTGGLYIRNNVAADVGGDIFIQAKSGEDSAKFTHDGSVELRYDNVKKFETTSEGALVSGALGINGQNLSHAANTLKIGHEGSGVHQLRAYGPDSSNNGKIQFRSSRSDGSNNKDITYSAGNLEFPDSQQIRLGTGEDFKLYHNGSHNYIQSDNGNLYLWGGGAQLRAVTDGTIELYYDGTKKFETTSVGCRIGGSTTASTAGDDLVIEGSSDRGLSIISGTTSSANIYFGDSDDTDIGRIAYQQNANALEFYTNAGKKGLLINSSGAVELYYDNVKQINTTSTGVTLGDDKRIDFGDGADLRIYHDGSSSYIDEVGTGSLKIQTNGTGVDIQKGSSETIARFIADGAVELYYDNAKTFSTSANACIVWGTEGNNATLYFHADDGDDWADYWNITATTAGQLDIQCRNNSGGFQDAITAIRDGAVELYYDSSKKCETTTDGIKLSGNGYADFPDNGRIRMGADYDLAIYHSGSHGFILNETGNLDLRSGEVGLYNYAGDEFLAKFTANGAVKLYYDHGLKLETLTAGVQVWGHLRIPDSNGTTDKLEIGNGQDLQIYHDGSNSYINNTTGILRIRDSEIRLCNTDNETYFTGVANGVAKLYYDDAVKLETESTGIGVTGNVDATGNLYGASLLLSSNAFIGDNNKLNLGTGNDLQIYHDGTNSHLNNSTGGLYIRNENIYLRGMATDEPLATFNANGAVELYYNNSKKFETISTGINVTGGIRLGGNNAANECDDYEEGTFSLVMNPAGNSYSVSHMQAQYTKVGNVCHIQGWWRCSTANSVSGSLTVQGFPFAAYNNTGSGGLRQTLSAQVANANGNATDIVIQLTDNATTGSIMSTTDMSTGRYTWVATNIEDTTAVYINGSYLTT